MSQNRDPFPFPKYENDHNFTGIKQRQKLLYKKPTHLAQNDEPWNNLNNRATVSSMKRSALYQDSEVQKDSLDFHLDAVYNNHIDLFRNKNEILFQKETLMSNHRENDASKCETNQKEIKVWVNPQKTSIYSITGAIETYVCHSCVQSKDVSEEATQFRKLNSFPNENHQNLHKELLLSYKRGLLLEEKPELHRVLEQRRLEQHRAQERALLPPSDLEQELYKRQQKLQEYENEKMKCAEGKKNIPEFVLVKEKLRHISEQNG